MHVASSAILESAYDRKQRRLHVTFVSGHRYAYDDVPVRAHRAFVEADSKGGFFQAEIRDRYPYVRLS